MERIYILKTAALFLITLCLFAQGDGFTAASGMGFSADGRFDVGMEAQQSNTPGLYVADRIIPIQDAFGRSIFPKKVSFSGTASLRPRGHKGDYEYIEDSLIWLSIVGENGSEYVLFKAILKSTSQANTVYVPSHVLPDLRSLPGPPSNGDSLHLHMHVEMAGRGGANTEVQFRGQWE